MEKENIGVPQYPWGIASVHAQVPYRTRHIVCPSYPRILTVFDPPLVESADGKPMDTEDRQQSFTLESLGKVKWVKVQEGATAENVSLTWWLVGDARERERPATSPRPLSSQEISIAVEFLEGKHSILRVRAFCLLSLSRSPIVVPTHHAQPHQKLLGWKAAFPISLSFSWQIL